MNNVERSFVDGARAMREMWDGTNLLRAAKDILRSVDRGTAAFVATSTEGAALAAVCAALHDDGSVWRRVNLLAPTPLFDVQLVFVEPVAMGAAWTAAVRNRYPDARIAVPDVSRPYVSVAARAAAAA